ncbi:MAG: fatty acyl CoA synthetase [Lysobacteraceae bacterium]|nr:MAG: fatty acyl CoA synthetase [Xanthomonadaceae bacterium]
MLAWAATLAACLAGPAHAAPERAASEPAVDAGWILSRIARPVGSHTPFVEVRGSKLLKAPLRLSGEYRRPDAATLVREVRSPYAETTTLHAGEALIERAGQAPRRFSLSRVPELAAVQASFGALLSGDRARLERHFHVEGGGARGDWTLDLVPKDPALAQALQRVVLHGRGAELRCIETRPAGKGEVQRTLLAGAATRATAAMDAAALAALCTGDAGA